MKKQKKIKAPKVKYRFFDEKDEKGKKQHLHQIFRNNRWENLTGTSNVTKIISKPLTWWAAGKTLEVLGWKNSKLKINGKYQSVAIEERLTHIKPYWEGIRTMDDLAIIKLLDTAYRAHDASLDESADAGVDMHAELEEYVKYSMDKIVEANEEWSEKTIKFSQWAVNNIKSFLWSEVHSYDVDLWLGGISDCGAILKNGEYAIIDFKSHEEVYFSDLVQIAGYDILIGKNGGFDRNGKQLMKPPKKKFTKYLVVPFKNKDIQLCLDNQLKNPVDTQEFKWAFEAALVLFRSKSKYE